MENEFFFDEHPPDSGWSPPGSGDEPDGWGGYSWGLLGGGTGGGSGGGGGSWAEVEQGEEPEEEKPEWAEDEKTELFNRPFLKTCPDGSLLTDGVFPELLTGSLICVWPPQLLIWLSGEVANSHARCLIVRCSRKIELKQTNPEEEGTPHFRGFFDWIAPGEFELSAKWQAGHFDHAKINSARFAAFGVDLGYRVLPLQNFVRVMTVTVTENYEIYVNDIRGTLDGNKKFLE